MRGGLIYVLLSGFKVSQSWDLTETLPRLTALFNSSKAFAELIRSKEVHKIGFDVRKNNDIKQIGKIDRCEDVSLLIRVMNDLLGER